MSTIKSDSENLTLNAHGSGNDIKFQSNSVEVGSISDAGLMTATLFAGSGASLTALPAAQLTGTVADARFPATLPAASAANLTAIPAANITGTLPAISGANLTGVGVDGISSSADATAMTITSAEKIGIGTASPDSIVEIEGASPILTITDTDASGANFGLWIRELGSHGMPADGTAYGAFIGYDMADNELQIQMRNGSTTKDAIYITRADGNVGIGGTPGDKLDVFGGVAMFRRSDVNSSQVERIVGFKDGGGTERGSIRISNAATTYTSQSDYRLKENLNYTWDATARLKQLKPVRFNFIVDDTNTLVDGFLAHEVSSIVPEATSGEKDALQVWEAHETLPEGVSVGANKLDSEGQTIIAAQVIDQSKLVPLLVKTIQELEARITALE
jgi:hypothetical protein